MADMPTKDELELSSWQDVALQKRIDLTLGGKEGSMEIKVILDWEANQMMLFIMT
jgi:hypothetical protein